MASNKKNRGTSHKGKGNANHNEHKHEKEKDRLVCVRCYEVSEKSAALKDAEIEYYREHYAGQLAAQNKKYEDARQYKRMKSVEEFYASKNHEPHEEILQYGNVTTPADQLPTPKEFQKMMDEYVSALRNWSKAHGNHLHILDTAGHYDEATPHGHIRYVWDYEDENGVTCVGQDKGLEQAGIKVPDPDKLQKDLEEAEKIKERQNTYEKGSEEYKKAGAEYRSAVKYANRMNNRLVTFTEMTRNTWYNILEKHGFNVEREPLENRKSKDIRAYKATQEEKTKNKEKALNERENSLDEREESIGLREFRCDEREYSLDQKDKELQEKEKKLREKALKNEQQAKHNAENAQNVVKGLMHLRSLEESYEAVLDRVKPQNEREKAMQAEMYGKTAKDKKNTQKLIQEMQDIAGSYTPKDNGGHTEMDLFDI